MEELEFSVSHAPPTRFFRGGRIWGIAALVIGILGVSLIAAGTALLPDEPEYGENWGMFMAVILWIEGGCLLLLALVLVLVGRFSRPGGVAALAGSTALGMGGGGVLYGVVMGSFPSAGAVSSFLDAVLWFALMPLLIARPQSPLHMALLGLGGVVGLLVALWLRKRR